MKRMEMPIQMDMDGISIEVFRKPIKHMYMRVHASTGDVRVTAPLRMPINTIQIHVSSKRDWIQAVRTRAIARTQLSPIKIEDGEQIPFLGTSYPLMIHTHAPLNRIMIDDSTMHYWTKTNAHEDVIKKLHDWYKQQMQALLPELIQKWEPIIGVSVVGWGIKPMKTRWGSCNVITHRISLNLHLIKMPLACLEYVLVHEMVHLLEANHSPRFYALMSRFMPTWKVLQKQLESVSLRST